MSASAPLAPNAPVTPGTPATPAGPVAPSRPYAWLLLIGGLLGLAASAVLTFDKIRLLQNPGYRPSCNINRSSAAARSCRPRRPRPSASPTR